LKERKLIVYYVLPTQFKKGLASNKWTDSKLLYQEFKRSNFNFEILLFGLDGKIKLFNYEFLPCKVLFNTIDKMPMRQSEIRKK
jgi:hypothetical protein